MSSRIIDDVSEFIFVSDEPVPSDAIFLPGGSHPAQPEYAARLYLDGFAKWILPSGGVSVKRGSFAGVRAKADVYDGDYKTDCEFFTDVLKKCGVPEEAIIGEDKSGHTRDNAFMSAKVVEERGLEINSAIIVCKAFHARRCLMLYQAAFPAVRFAVCPVHCFDITTENWYKTDEGIDRVLGELSRCGNQFVDEIKKYCMIRREL